MRNMHTVHAIDMASIDLAAPGGLAALMARNRARYGSIVMEGETGGGEGGAGTGTEGAPATGAGTEGGGDGGNDADRGFPPNTPWRDMEPAQQAAYWQFQSRKHEGAYKGLGNVEQLKADAAAFRKYQEEHASDQDRAVASARQEAEAAAVERMSGVLVQQAFQIAAGGRIPADQLTAYLEDVDLKRFRNEDGTPNLERIQNSVTRLAPAPAGGGGRDGWPAGSYVGGGKPAGGLSAREQGIEEARRRGFGVKTQQ